MTIINILSLQERKLPVLYQTPAPQRCHPGALFAVVAKVVDARVSVVEFLAMWPCDTACLVGALQTIAAYFRSNWVIINKLQGKAVTHGEKLEWWIILMVDCVTILLHF